MPHPYYPSGNPHFNHVAMSMPAELLDEANRADISRFWSDVFGFDEITVMTEDRRRLILSCVHWDHPMQAPRMDHFGFAVGALEELQGIQERAETFRGHDDRVDLIDLHVDDQKVVKIHSLYVKYILPMMCEVQWWEFAS
jgi:hypothetical protein